VHQLRKSGSERISFALLASGSNTSFEVMALSP
jgi:hypothetical protein